MQNRRKFLAQTTLAAGSLMFLNPLKTLASTPNNSLQRAGKLTILNLDRFSRQLSPANSSFLQIRFSRLISGKTKTLLLSTGNVISSKNSHKTDHLRELVRLKSVGCDAAVPSQSDLVNGFPYYKNLVNECELRSLTADKSNNSSSEHLPHHIVFKGKVKIGIIGNEVKDHKASLDSDVKEVARKLNKTASFLKELHDCNLIVAMNPSTANSNVFKKEKELTALTENIDVIVSSNSPQKIPVTYVVKNTLRREVILNYQGSESVNIKGIDISFNDKNEKINFALRKMG